MSGIFLNDISGDYGWIELLRAINFFYSKKRKGGGREMHMLQINNQDHLVNKIGGFFHSKVKGGGMHMLQINNQTRLENSAIFVYVSDKSKG